MKTIEFKINIAGLDLDASADYYFDCDNELYFESFYLNGVEVDSGCIEFDLSVRICELILEELTSND